MTDKQIMLHAQLTTLINMVQQYVKVVEEIPRDDPSYARAYIRQLAMETRIKDLLIAVGEFYEQDDTHRNRKKNSRL
jgi:hypothetical protein